MQIALGNAQILARPSAAIAYHDRQAEGWTARYSSGGFRRRAAFLSKVILPLASPHGRWIDVGCGSGYFTRLLAERGATSVVGIDGSAAMIRLARAYPLGPVPSPDYQHGAVESLIGLEALFDGVLCLSVLEYLADPAASFAALAAVLRPGGWLIASAPHRASPLRGLQLVLRRLAGVFGLSLFEYLGSSRHSWSREGIVAEARRHGLACHAVFGFDPITPRSLWGLVTPSLLFLVCRKIQDGSIP
jgi:2-polyprenyl-6-hydroxyphenyl methylase/3-demethylubiquinone-9 3-methyltransferase